MSNYQRILVAVDFSEVSEHAARRAMEIAEFYQAQLVFLHVIEHFPEHLPHYRMSEEGKEMDPEEYLLDRAQQDLKAICARLDIDGAEQVVRLTRHSAKAEILEYIQDKQINLAVLGARGRHRLADLLAGSTATGIVRTATCDVLTVRGAG